MIQCYTYIVLVTCNTRKDIGLCNRDKERDLLHDVYEKRRVLRGVLSSELHSFTGM